jgi:quinol monooxygenase YgiN
VAVPRRRVERCGDKHAQRAPRNDEIAPPLIEKLKTQPGFILHTAFTDSGRFTVAEVWESQEQHDRWFTENVKPNLPGDVEQELIELHNVVQP